MSMSLERVLDACQRHRDRDLEGLFRLLRQPSISTQGIGMAETPALVEDALTAAGFNARRFATPGQPMIFAERTTAPGKPTVLIYGHYDVQPPDPLDQWISPPFEPTIRDGKLFARGAGDNKGQFFAQICGARAWLETTGDLPVNVKFLIEGEEETGSPHLDDVVAAHRDLLAADLVYTSDGPVHDRDFPQVVYGVRGVIGWEFRARSANHDLHSGNWGGIAPNPAWTLVRLLATMMDDQNRILIPGFMDDVQPVSPAMRAAMDAIPLDTTAALAGIGLDQLPPPDGVGYFDRLMALPTLNIAGIHSGYGGPGNKTVLPSTAVLKMDTRLVPHQRTADIIAKVTEHVRRHAPDVEIEVQGTMEPSSTPVDHPFAEPVRLAVERGFGRRPVDVPLLGGSLPDATWTRTLGAPSFLVPYANPDEDNHAPNENIEVERFFNGIRTAASLFAELADGALIRQDGDRDGYR